MILVLKTELTDSINSLLEIYRFAETFIFEGMSYNRSITIVMHIYFYTFYAIIKVLQVSFYLGITRQLISRKIGIMRTITEVVRQR